MSDDFAVLQFIPFPGTYWIKVNQQRIPLHGTTVTANADVLMINHDIARLPVKGIIKTIAQPLCMAAEKDEQIIDPAKIDIRIRCRNSVYLGI